MKLLNYWIFRLFVGIFSILPFKLIYFFSNFLAWFLKKILRYRYKTISENIDLVYPKIDDNTQKILISDIYTNLADIMLEGIKGLSLSEKEIKKRHVFTNPELLDNTYKNNQSVILLCGHYNNWEWSAFSSVAFFKHTPIGFYKPLTNSYIDKYVVNKRAKNGCVLANINLTSQFYSEYHDKTAVFLVAADQSPTKPELAIWTEFLGINTPCLHGIDKYVERYNLPVAFCHIERVTRGKYEINMEWIKRPEDLQSPYGEVTKSFMNRLEKKIIENPSSWLWSHRRWKHRNFRIKNVIP